MKFLNNLAIDLAKARISSHLIWISHEDFKQVRKEANSDDDAVLAMSHAVFDRGISDKSTNLIVLNGLSRGDGSKKFQIGHAIYEVLSDHFKDELTKQFAVSAVAGGLKAAINLTGVGGVLLNTLPISPEYFVASALDGAIDFITKIAVDGAKIASESVSTNTLEAFSDLAAKRLLTEYFKDRNHLHISGKATTELRNVFSKLQKKKDLESNDIFASLFEFCAAASLGDASAKLLVIRNPEHLDLTSIDFLGRILSTMKALKAQDKHIPFSILLVFESPAKTGEDESATALKKLNVLKMFAGRYGFLETPSTNAPKLVVRHSTFVGRHDQLKLMEKISNRALCASDNQPLKNNGMPIKSNFVWATVVSAEPGTGKTMLCNRHLETFFDDTHNLQKSERTKRRGVLRLNIGCSPHSSGGISGIPSLLHSIAQQHDRIVSELSIHGKLTKKGSELFIEEGSKGVFSTLVSKGISISLGVDIKPLMNAANNAYKRVEIVNDIHEFFAGHKKSEFSFDDYAQKLIAWVVELHRLGGNISECDATLPISLMLDDFQWLDEPCAEFIAAYLMGRFPLRLLVTVREGDLKNVLDEAIQKPETKPYFLVLAAQLGLLKNSLPEFVTNKMDALSERYQNMYAKGDALKYVERIDLPGFDGDMLKEVIKTSIGIEQNDGETLSGERAQWMAESIINYLSLNNTQANTANSLFAVETLNMICDPSWGGDGAHGQWKSVYWRQGKPYFTGDALKANRNVFQKNLDDQLVGIRKKYIGAIIPEGMTLSSLAVLEERLHLIKDHFRAMNGEGDGAGNYVAAFLFFASLSGGSFMVGIIIDILEALSLSESPTGLKNLTEQFKKKLGTLNTPAKHEALSIPLENTYELLQELSNISRFYAFKHSLLPIFLSEKFNALFDETALKTNAKEIVELKSWAVRTCLIVIDQKDDWHDVFRRNPARHEHANSILQLKRNFLNYGYKADPSYWGIEFAKFLWDTGNCYTYKESLTAEVIGCHEQALEVCHKLYLSDEDRYSGYFAKANIILGNAFSGIANDRSVSYIWVGMTLYESLYAINSDQWATDYIHALIDLGFACQQDSQKNRAVDCIAQGLKICEQLQANDAASEWKEIYAFTLNNMGKILADNFENDRAIPFYEKSLTIWNELNNTNITKVARSRHADTLQNLADMYLCSDKETLYCNEAVKIRRELFSSNMDSWAGHNYLRSLNKLASAYASQNRSDKAISHCEEGVRACEILYHKHPEIFAFEYMQLLGNLGISQSHMHLHAPSIKHLENALAIYNGVNGSMTDHGWIENIEYVLQSTKQIKGDIENLVENEKKLKNIFINDTEHWGTEYTDTLRQLVSIYEFTDNADQAILHCERLVEALEKLYTCDQARWGIKFAQSLAKFSILVGGAPKAVSPCEVIVESFKQLYATDPDQVWNDYAESLFNLCVVYFHLGRNEESDQLLNQVEKIKQDHALPQKIIMI